MSCRAYRTQGERGSLEALQGSLSELGNDEVQVKIVSGGVGGITETDANLALASEAILVGFNVRADASAREIVEREGLDLRYYSVIYQLIDEVKQAMSGMLEPEWKEEIVGVAEDDGGSAAVESPLEPGSLKFEKMYNCPPLPAPLAIVLFVNVV